MSAALDSDAPEKAVAVLDPAAWGVDAWVQALVPLRFSRGDAQIAGCSDREQAGGDI